MASETTVDDTTGRKFFLDHPLDADRGDLSFVLTLHGGGSGHTEGLEPNVTRALLDLMVSVPPT